MNTYAINPVHHKHLLIRILISAFTALFIVLHGRWNLIGEAVFSPSFYFAFLLSFAVACLLMYIVGVSTRWLDKRYPWQADFYRRSALQLLFGLIIPSAVDLLFAGVYLNALGQDLKKSGFLLFDFPVIFLFLVLVNVYYFIRHYMPQQASHDAPFADKTADNLTIYHNGTHVQLSVCRDVLYCCRMGKRVAVYTRGGASYHTDLSLGNLLRGYEEAGLMQVNRSLLINYRIAQGYSRGSRRDTLQIIINNEYRDIPAMRDISLFVVTKEHIRAFKGLFEDEKCRD